MWSGVPADTGDNQRFIELSRPQARCRISANAELSRQSVSRFFVSGGCLSWIGFPIRAERDAASSPDTGSEAARVRRYRIGTAW
jgi:hypothetical protein